MQVPVAIVGNYPVNANRIHGGVQAAFAYLVRGLSRIEDLDLHVITFAPQGWNGPDCIEQDRVTLHLLPAIPALERLRSYRHYQVSINKALGQIHPAVVHTEDLAMNAFVALRSGYPTVVTVHGIIMEDGKYFRSLSNRLRNLYDSLILEPWVLRRARHLIAISQYVTDYYAPKFRPDLHVYYIPNAVDDRFFNLESRPDSHTIVYAGRVIPRKRVEDLIKAFAQVVDKVPDARLRIAGEMVSEPVYATEVRELTHQLNLDQQVHFLGQLTEPQVFQEYQDCGIVALASAQETLPMCLAQAMAAGIPVVSTRVGGVADMLGDNEARGLLVNVGDITGLAAALESLLMERALRERISHAARSFACQNYHVDQVARRTFEVYRQIAFEEQRAHA